MLRFPSDGVIVHTCSKCGWKDQFNNQKLGSQYAIADLMMEWVEKSLLAREVLLQMMAEALERANDD
jgi:RNase P subunit RPR2